MLISSLHKFFVKVLQIHFSKNKSQNEILNIIQVNSYFLNDYINTSRRLSPKKVVSILDAIHNMDLKIKNINSNFHNNLDILQELILYTTI